jgi:KilA-N domain
MMFLLISVNVTQMCQANEKQFNDYGRLESTKTFWDALSAETGIPVSGLVITIKGGNDKKIQGTWTHPEIAIDCAQWVNVEFRIWANRTLRKLISSQPVIEVPQQSKRTIPSMEEISTLLDLTLGKAGLEPKLVAGAKLNAIGKRYPHLQEEAEEAKSMLLVPVKDKLLVPKKLGEILTELTCETWSAQRVNKLLIEQGFQVRNPEGSPDYLPTEKGKPYSQLTLGTAKGHDKTVQHLRWFETVLEVMQVEARDSFPSGRSANGVTESFGHASRT